MVKGLLDLEKHFAFYGAYHCNRVNILIHVLFVWPIFYTSLILLYFTPPLIHLRLLDSFPFRNSSFLVLNFGFLLILTYSLYYILLDKKAGSLAAVLCFLCWINSSYVASGLDYSLAWKVVLAAQLFCWTCQFAGHAVFEKRAPALLDNLSQAFLMAPFFVLLEVLWKLFAYEPYPGFQESVEAKIEADRVKWKATQQKKIF